MNTIKIKSTLHLNYSCLATLLVIFCFSTCAKPETITPEEGLQPVLEQAGLNMPYIVIDTKAAPIIDEPKISASLTIFEKQKVILRTNIGIELRGSTSQELFPKKSYGFETKDSLGEDKSISILGMPEEEDWILYGPYNDKTLLRDVIAYELSNAIGQYATKTKFVDLQINKTYVGVYVMMEKIKRDKNRVNIKKLEPADNSNTSITGGYIIKIDKTTGDGAGYNNNISFRSNYDVNGNRLPPFSGTPKNGRETYYLYEYPKAEDISQAQRAYIQGFIADMELAIVSDSFKVTPRPYTNFLDLPSFIDYTIINELVANVDAYRLSTFMYKDRGGKLKFGPVWDFNISCGIEGRSRTDRWIFNYNVYNPDDYWLVPFQFTKLMNDPLVKKAFKDRWTQLRSATLSTSAIEKMVTDKSTFLNTSGAVKRNYTTWDIMNKPVPFADVIYGSYDKEVNFMIGWLKQRLTWIDGQVVSW
jgi:hypothetical protein